MLLPSYTRPQRKRLTEFPAQDRSRRQEILTPEQAGHQSHNCACPGRIESISRLSLGNCKNVQVELEERETVEKLKKGDLEAFDRIYGLYSAKLYAFGRKYLRSEADAEELVQTVFIKIWENRKKIDSELSFRSWLFTIAYNDICKQFRSRSYLQKYVAETINTGTDASSETEKGTEYQSVLDQVRKIVDTLPETQKRVFIKSRFEGRPAKEIAEEMNLTPSTVDNYISAALRLIRSGLGRENLPVILFIFLFIA